MAEIPDDLLSHREAWRSALVAMQGLAAPATADMDDRSYWTHELEVFDRTFEALSAPAFAVGSRVRPRGVEVEGELIEFNAECTGALIRWPDGEEVWKALRSLEVVPRSPEAPLSGRDVNLTRGEARRLVNYAFMASSARWTPFIRENGVGGEDSPWVEFLRVADRLWTVLFPDHPIRQIDPRLPAESALPVENAMAVEGFYDALWELLAAYAEPRRNPERISAAEKAARRLCLAENERRAREVRDERG